MASVYPLVEIITRLSVVNIPPVLSPWEMCSLELLYVFRPKTIYFVCETARHCPSKDLYKLVPFVPSQTLLGLKTEEMPILRRTDMIFLPFHRNFVVWNNETVQKYRWSKHNDFKIVFVGDMSDNRSHDLERIENLFSALWESGVVSSAVVLKNASSAQIFTYSPFKNSSLCEDTSPVLLGECMDVAKEVFDLKYKIHNFNGCPLRVTSLDDRPFIQYPLRGRLSGIIQAVARVLNATLLISQGNRSGNCGPNEFRGTRRQLIEGQAHVSFELAHDGPCSIMGYTHLRLTSCLSWCTPVLKDINYVFAFIVGQYQPSVWVALLLTIFAVVLSVLSLRSLAREPFSTHNIFGLAFAMVTNVHMDFRSTPIRLIVGLWLSASLVLQTAYEAELKSQSAVPMGSQVIEDLKTLLEMKIRLCSLGDNLQALQNQEDPILKKICDLTEVCPGAIYDTIARAAIQQDYAVFTARLRCRVTADDVNPDTQLLYPDTGGCWRTVQLSTMVTMPGSPYRKKCHDAQQRCVEGGLVQKWLRVDSFQVDKGHVKRYSLKQLLPVLFILCVGHIFAFTTFLAEIAISRRSSRKKIHQPSKAGID